VETRGEVNTERPAESLLYCSEREHGRLDNRDSSKKEYYERSYQTLMAARIGMKKEEK
jgi:hypothetical protein